jgi:lipopolysaccharide export system protein LptA
MKTVKIILVAIIATVLSSNSYVQSQGLSKTGTTRIEKAAKLDGVSKAEWDAKSKALTVTFDSEKTTMDLIGKKVASVGHDNDKAKADDKVYSALPGCCKYR